MNHHWHETSSWWLLRRFCQQNSARVNDHITYVLGVSVSSKSSWTGKVSSPLYPEMVVTDKLKRFSSSILQDLIPACTWTLRKI
jgi:hypothetical protein